MKNKTLWIIGGVVVLIIIIGIFSGSNNNTNTQSPVSGTSSAPITSSTADYEKQHNLLLINEAPNPYQPVANGPTTSSIYVVHADGTGKTLLTSDGGAPSWTPDGKIIFSSNRSGSQQIWMMDADGSNAKQIGNLSAGILPLMPQMGENSIIVFTGATADGIADNNPGIWVMQSDGSGLKEIIRGQQPFLARSGTWISYTLQANIPDGSGNPFNRQIWRINTDGTGKQQLTHLGDSDYPDANASSISPDEKLVAFFSGKESSDNPQQTVFDFGYRNVAIVPATGGARTTLTLCKPVTTPAELDVATHASGTCIAADNPAWTPDGKWLLVDTGWADGGGTYMVDINGQNFQQFYPENRGIVRVPLKSF